MRENKGFISLCCLFGIGALYQVYDSRLGGSIADIIPFLLFIATGFILFIIAVSRCVRACHLPWPQRLVPVYFWLLPLVFCFVYERWLDRINNGPNWLRITNHESVGYAGFDFKKDGRYKYETGSPLGLFFSYGKYVQTDSLLTLYPESTNDRLVDTVLVIRPYPVSSNPCFTKTAVVVPFSKNKEAVRTNLYYIVDPVID